MRANPRPAHPARIPIHAAFPLRTQRRHGRHALIPSASILSVLRCAGRHLGHDGGHRGFRGLVHVGANRRPETVHDVDDEGDEEVVEQELGVVG